MSSNQYFRNRQRLQQAMPNQLLILTAYTQQQRSNDAAFSFAQEANFWWLTGIEEPDWWLILDGKTGKSWLVAPAKDDIHVIFDGSITNEQAKMTSGVDKVISRVDAEQLLVDLANKYKTVSTLGKDPRAKHYNFALNPAPGKMLRKLKRTFKEVKDCQLELARLRAIKQPDEIHAIRRAVQLTVEAFNHVKQTLPNLKHEYEVEAAFSYYFKQRGGHGHAYDPIVASGGHACTLHYVRNNAPLAHNKLLLLDVGARIDGYAADISRTYALGTPTDRQRAVHAAVESAHREIIALLKPGLKVKAYSEKVDEIMKSALDSLGLLKTDKDYRTYFPHSVSHGLGVDVHDALGRPTEFQAGMVITVEPGIYIPEEGIGVRIEDDILITKTGHENLSSGLPTSL